MTVATTERTPRLAFAELLIDCDEDRIGSPQASGGAHASDGQLWISDHFEKPQGRRAELYRIPGRAELYRIPLRDG